ncbi:hypothetical protein PPL_03739 [Heterostelium album PN500]|uniref:Uncharacterized protein n=1 Tax=Heterostelium pallidum (strain ATCC 26659 / Pp 5 / PN500) TaxID=670386 RepID=D3B6J1_HETP5|nr:hypothetical protein PPL_03739 [Heterostelium album PN500]EFA82961.1 hypothetical protein PPL_03739 [Heterostelium album PN500]|eukprot:XP_020435078.1 hypothetical protein PPL_03739 [Heterostelium album PN500]
MGNVYYGNVVDATFAVNSRGIFDVILQMEAKKGGFATLPGVNVDEVLGNFIVQYDIVDNKVEFSGGNIPISKNADGHWVFDASATQATGEQVTEVLDEWGKNLGLQSEMRNHYNKDKWLGVDFDPSNQDAHNNGLKDNALYTSKSYGKEFQDIANKIGDINNHERVGDALDLARQARLVDAQDRARELEESYVARDALDGIGDPAQRQAIFESKLPGVLPGLATDTPDIANKRIKTYLRGLKQSFKNHLKSFNYMENIKLAMGGHPQVPAAHFDPAYYPGAEFARVRADCT